MLLLKWLHHLSKAKRSFSNLASMPRLNPLPCRDLRRWLENPFGTPPIFPLAELLSLDLSRLGQAISADKGGGTWTAASPPRMMAVSPQS